MKQAVLKSKETIEFSETNTPTIQEDEVLLKIKYVGICGSDIHAYYGEHPFMSFPIRLGHELSGEVIELGSNVKGFNLGEYVTIMPQEYCGKCEPCLEGRYNICENLKVIGCQTNGGACEFLNVKANLLKKLPPNFPLELGATIEPAAVGVHAVRQGSGVKDKNVVVLGAGTIGNCTAQAAMAEGAKSVLITDLSDYRLNIARKCGIPYAINTSNKSLKEAIKSSFNGEGADIFFECIGIGSTVNEAIENSKKGNDVVIVGVFGNMPEIDLGLVQDKELRLIGSLMYVEKDFQDTINYMNDKIIKMDELIANTFDFKDYDEAFKYIEKNKDRSLKILIKVNDD